MNQSPGYSCNCIPEFYGTQCETSYDDCSEDFTICRNGICIDQARNETDVPAFRYFSLKFNLQWKFSQSCKNKFSCFCNNGWQHDDDMLCTRDINECLGSPCYVGVQCVNTPGSFYCGSCPTGYEGNGLQCTDINECLKNNGGCSTSPPVDCVNTPGET